MATPGEGYSSNGLSALNSEDESSGGGKLRKRSRRSLDESKDDIPWELTEDGRPKTRRVNPQRLALRLGPELVAEMEAYIVPGAKMPPFSIRKDFQERYSVDRRHIYDYFHSRGLRVAKEDKHTNLIRGRAMKAKALAQAQSRISSKLFASVKEEDVPTSGTAPSNNRVVKPTKSLPSLPGRPAKRSTKTQEKKSNYMRRSTAVSSRPVKKTRSADCLVHNSFSGASLSQISGGMSSCTDTDSGSASVSPQFTIPCDSSDESAGRSTASDFLPSPSDFLPGFFESPNPQPFLDVDGFAAGGYLEPFDSVEHLLTIGERTELYDLISDSMAWSNGAERSSSILPPFGNEDSRTYLAPRVPAHHLVNSGKTGLNTAKTSVPAFEPAFADGQDLKIWLSDDLDFHQPVLDGHGFYQLRNGFDGLHEAYFGPVISGNSAMAADSYQPAILSPQNRALPLKVSMPVAYMKQDYLSSRADTENSDAMHLKPTINICKLFPWPFFIVTAADVICIRTFLFCP